MVGRTGHRDAPGRQGHRRIYSWEELVTVAVICQLRRRGFSLQRMRKVIGFLQQEFGTGLAATVSASSGVSPAHRRHSFYLRTSARQVVDLLKNARQPMFDICLSDEVRRVRAEIQSREEDCGFGASWGFGPGPKGITHEPKRKAGEA